MLVPLLESEGFAHKADHLFPDVWWPALDKTVGSGEIFGVPPAAAQSLSSCSLKTSAKARYLYSGRGVARVRARVPYSSSEHQLVAPSLPGGHAQ